MNEDKNQNKTRFSFWRLKIIKYKYRNQNKNDPYIKTKGLLTPFYLFIIIITILLFYFCQHIVWEAWCYWIINGWVKSGTNLRRQIGPTKEKWNVDEKYEK